MATHNSATDEELYRRMISIVDMYYPVGISSDNIEYLTTPETRRLIKAIEEPETTPQWQQYCDYLMARSLSFTDLTFNHHSSPCYRLSMSSSG